MFIKLILNLVIICCSTVLGNYIANGYVHRVRQLYTLQMGLSKLETEIIYYSTLLPEALASVGNSISGSIGSFLYDVSENLNNKNSPNVEAAWKLALDRNRSYLKMTCEDYEIIDRFGCQLGTADSMSQRQLFEVTQLQLTRQQEEAEEDRKRYEKMYRSLGFLSGLTIVIILF